MVWINGPFHVSMDDITIFSSKDNPSAGLKSHIPDGKRAIGVSGYSGEPTKVFITRPGDSYTTTPPNYGGLRPTAIGSNQTVTLGRMLVTYYQNVADSLKMRGQMMQK